MYRVSAISFLIAVLIAPLVVAPRRIIAASHTSVTPVQLQAYLQRVAATGFSGTVVVAQRGIVQLHAGFGLANELTRTPVTTDTVFVIGSISKQFTAAAILQLEEQGRLHVTDQLDQHLPAVPHDKAAITIHQLLTHTAGLVSDHARDDFEPLTRADALQRILRTPLRTAPATQYHYSNSGYTILAMVVEQVSGQAYHQYVRSNLVARAGLTHTGFWNDGTWEQHAMANAYINGDNVGAPVTWPVPSWVVVGNGDVLSTAGDLYRWWQALHDHKILTPQQTQKLWTRHTVKEDAHTYYGYGWSLEDTPYGPMLGHEGGGVGGNSDVAVYLDQEIVVIITSNRLTYRTLFDTLPYDVYRPAFDTRQQLVANMMQGDFERLPTPTLRAVPWLLGGGTLVTLAAVLVVVRRRRRRTA